MVQVIGFICAAVGIARIGQDWFRVMADGASPGVQSGCRIFHCLLSIVSLLVVAFLAFVLAASGISSIGK